jgi:hypothetical protein
MKLIDVAWGSSIDRDAKQNRRLTGPPTTIESIVDSIPL